MNRKINKVAILGSGVMGSGIACHFANIGVEVILLDLIPKKNSSEINDITYRNNIVNDNLQKSINSKPSPLYDKKFLSRISIGNFIDDFSKISKADWIIEAVVENLEIKKKILKKIEKFRTPGTILISNTSGIPIKKLCFGLSIEFQQHFLITHFFNPPRYLKLLEVIPSSKCKKNICDFILDYGSRFLGKSTVLCNDTPGFIGNRIGIFSILNLLHNLNSYNLSIEEIDLLTGPVIGRPKSATFRTLDLVGIDTLIHVANEIFINCENDEKRNIFKIPDFIEKMSLKNYLGSKSGKGFYKKIKRSGETKSIIKVLNLNTFEYLSQAKAKINIVKQAKKIKNVSERFKFLIDGDNKFHMFYKRFFGEIFSYIQNMIPEISDNIYKIDEAMRSGFGWKQGPFEIWDAIGLKNGIKLIKDSGNELSEWVKYLEKNELKKFYAIEDNFKVYFDVLNNKYSEIPNQKSYVLLENYKENKTVWENEDCSIIDIGDGILNIEFNSKMNTIGSGILQGLNKAIEIGEKNFQGLIIGNEGDNFSAGADLGMIFMMSVEQEYEKLDIAIKYFQETMMKLRYSNIPTIASPHGLTLGGGCELCMHADKVVAAAETYIGLVEFGVGLIPGGGGTKEMTLRTSESFKKNDVELNILRESFLNIAMAKVSESAYQAFGLGIFQKEKDYVVVENKRLLGIAKQEIINIANRGYTKPIKNKEIKVLGKQSLGMFYVGSDSMMSGNYISKHDKKIANKLAYVMSGGDLSEPSYVSEDYLLEIEREAFLSLCGEKKTLERIEHMLKTGKPLRN